MLFMAGYMRQSRRPLYRIGCEGGGIAASVTLQEGRSYIRRNEWFEDV